MVMVGNRPFLDHLVSFLVRNGIKNFVFCVGYLAEQIQDYFEDGGKWDCKIAYSVEATPLGTGGAIKQASSFLRDTFLLMNGDNYLPLDYRGFIQKCDSRISSEGIIGIVTALHNGSPLFKSNLLLDRTKRRVLDYNYHDPKNKDHMDCGVKIFSKKLLNFFGPEEKFSLEIDVMPRLSQMGLLGAYEVSCPPFDIGDPAALESTRHELLHKYR